jgi:hypothetical protein
MSFFFQSTIHIPQSRVDLDHHAINISALFRFVTLVTRITLYADTDHTQSRVFTRFLLL